MSEKINNREYRQKVIKDIISQLHVGKDPEEVKKQFQEAFEGVSASEISDAEQALISEGLPISEVQRLCDVHSAVFKGSIEDIHNEDLGPGYIHMPSHPVNAFKSENREIERLLEELRAACAGNHEKNNSSGLINCLEDLSKLNLHYLKKENLLFPYMEKYGITAPPKVMWGVDDEIRFELKSIKEALQVRSEKNGKITELLQRTQNLSDKITEMIYKEENIMLPMLTDILTEDEWKLIAQESAELGYIITDVPPYIQQSEKTGEIKQERDLPGVLSLPTGVLKFNEVIEMLNTLPFDITFVDKDDTVKYFSQGKDRIFPRTKAIIGRKVTDCHPPASVHIVEKIVEDFKAGIKNHEDFWINAGEKFVFIRYFAVRGENDEYLGVLEVTQDIKPIQDISGEKRLLSV